MTAPGPLQLRADTVEAMEAIGHRLGSVVLRANAGSFVISGFFGVNAPAAPTPSKGSARSIDA